ncbi:MAG: DUF2116 family Zn-ribbon domain-containing protein [Candidatus Bathyarchaeia archaeon]
MAKNCRVCGKPIPEGLDFCSEECMKTYKSDNPKVPLDKSLENDLLDPTYMRGLSWRKAKLEAIHKARLQGIPDEQILLILMRGGLTRLTAKKMMDDSKQAYGG